MVKQSFLAGVCAVAAMSATAADITISKPYFRWLFNGFGFQNSEANFLRIMLEDFRDQRVLKTFRELSPSFARVYTGFADSTKEELDSFADYIDRTPPAVGGVELKGGVLSWTASTGPAHVYYRVYRDGVQIASTVATRLDVKGAKGDYAVRSVDRWNNVGR